ncbi:hypothetical protein OYC64_015455 [Pagothenia borchgrevinki]|uniref:Uncharacterized protein n=1 Tax=Pagothenia borchgrevinki TaxID=8213 RepID=A0ABD2HFH8_PAGBO
MNPRPRYVCCTLLQATSCKQRSSGVLQREEQRRTARYSPHKDLLDVSTPVNVKYEIWRLPGSRMRSFGG